MEIYRFENAISRPVRQILKAAHIICSVPGERKAQAGKNCLEHPVDNRYHASILQMHPNCSYYLDEASAGLLSGKVLGKVG